MEKQLYFKDLNIGDKFDFIPPSGWGASFFKTCTKTSTRKYIDADGRDYRVGSIACRVYHIQRKEEC